MFSAYYTLKTKLAEDTLQSNLDLFLEVLRQQLEVKRETLRHVGTEAPLEAELVGVYTWRGG